MHALVSPRDCPHRLPTDVHRKHMQPGTPIRCIWCQQQFGVKDDPRKFVGARFLSRWDGPAPDRRFS